MLAVLRATPGNSVSSSMVFGTSPWNFSTSSLAAGFEVSGFVVVEAGGVDVFFDFCYWRFGVVFGGVVFFEEGLGDFVDLDVGGLGGEHGGY